MIASAAVIGLALPVAAANPWSPLQTTVPVTMFVQPMAQIAFPSGASLHLYVPPANSTLPDNGVPFTVTGNANATVTAAPSAYLFVNPYIVNNNPLAPRYLGKATHTLGYEIGYNLAVEFPADGVSYHFLPSTNGASTSPATVNVSGGPVPGFIHMQASHRWTPNATMPAVGDYNGSIIVTLTASSL
jgi:hypothetical protein